MPPKISFKERFQSYIKEYANSVFKTDGKVLFCISCEKAINRADERKSVVVQHLETIHAIIFMLIF